MSVYEYAQQWKKTFKQTREANTQAMYENIIEKKIVALSGVKLSEVSRIHFQQLINNNADHPRTCQQIQVAFKQIIKSAIWDSRLPADSSGEGSNTEGRLHGPGTLLRVSDLRSWAAERGSSGTLPDRHQLADPESPGAYGSYICQQ